MGSHGIRDSVAIVGMGCTPFGEHWDKSAEDLLIDATRRRSPRPVSAKDDVDAYWLGTMGSGYSGHTLSRAAETRLQAGHPGGELLRHRVGGVPQRVLRGRIGRVRHCDGRSASRSSRTPASPGWSSVGTAQRRHRTSRSPPRRCSRLLAPAYAQEVRRRRRRHEGRHHPHRVEEPLQRRPQPARPVPQGGVEGGDLQRPLVAGQLGVFDCSGVSDGSAAAIIVRAEDAHQVHGQAALRQGAVHRRRPRRRPDGPDATTTPRSARWSSAPRTHTRRPASTDPRVASSRWPRCTTASRPPSWCSWRTWDSASGHRRGKRRARRRVRPRR